MTYRLLRAFVCLTSTALLLALLLGPAATFVQAQTEKNKSDRLLKQIGVERGICVLLGELTGESIIQLARASELTLYVQLAGSEKATALRQKIEAAGFLGQRVYVDTGSYKRIHLADNIADAVIVDGKPKDLTEKELMRVVHPGGVIIDASGARV